MNNCKKFKYEKPTEWKEYRANGIASNPIEYWYSVVLVGHYYRIYKIFPQFPNPNKDGFTIDDRLPPELYILTERIDLKDSNYVENPEGLHLNGDGHVVRVFQTMEEAKKRAVVQVSHIEAIAGNFFGDCNGNE